MYMNTCAKPKNGNQQRWHHFVGAKAWMPASKDGRQHTGTQRWTLAHWHRMMITWTLQASVASRLATHCAQAHWHAIKLAPRFVSGPSSGFGLPAVGTVLGGSRRGRSHCLDIARVAFMQGPTTFAQVSRRPHPPRYVLVLLASKPSCSVLPRRRF